MRAALFDPYLDTGGGGERYVLTVASVLAKHGWNVDVFWKDEKIRQWLEVRLGIDLSKINFAQEIGGGAGYDFVFWLSDGSIPTLFAKKNIIHFQTPFKDVGGKNLFNKLKFTKITGVVCNSKFTKGFIDKEYGIDSQVIYPPIDTNAFKSGKKENVILYVGRFSQLQQAKRQDVLVESFKKMYKQGIRDWKLVLLGGSDIGGRKMVQELKEQSVGYPVEILENLPFEEVKKYCSKAKIFWSAAGYGVDPEKDPQKVEHFGISVVEAMSSGCVPIVVAKGGHKEIIEDEKNGFLWDTNDELVDRTTQLISNERRREKIAKEAKKASKKFSIRHFEEEIVVLAA